MTRQKAIKVLQEHVVLSLSRYKESQIISISWRSLRSPIVQGEWFDRGGGGDKARGVGGR